MSLKGVVEAVICKILIENAEKIKKIEVNIRIIKLGIDKNKYYGVYCEGN
jgi:hypothetical protein